MAGLTQEELASRASLTAKAISALERGERRRPYPHTVRALADALELSEENRAALTEAAVSDAARERLGEQDWATAQEEGRAMSFEEAVAYARDGDEALPSGRTETPASE